MGSDCVAAFDVLLVELDWQAKAERGLSSFAEQTRSARNSHSLQTSAAQQMKRVACAQCGACIRFFAGLWRILHRAYISRKLRIIW